MNAALIDSLIKFFLRRGLTILGGSAASISDDDLSKFVGVALLILNELIQFYQAHKHEKRKAEYVRRPR